MRDISKRLTVINTEKKDNASDSKGQSSGVTYVGFGGGGMKNLNDYLLKSIWDRVWEIRTDSQGTEYIFGKLPVVTQYGITMYSGENTDIPTIAEGLPFDNRTIWFNPNTKRIEVIGGTGGGSGEGVSNFWDLSGIPSWITNTKPTYSYSEIQGTPDLSVYALKSDIPSLSGYATEQWVLGKGYALSSDLSKYIPIAGVTDITGEKNFTGGLKVNGSPIYYDTEKKYWKLEGDLLVTGGVTMYGNDSDFVASTIMDAILYDDTTLGINSQGQLYVKGSVGGATTMGSLSNVGSWADSVASQDRIMYQAANSSRWVAKNLSDLAVGGVTGDYLPLSGGELSGSLAVTAIQNGYWAGGIRIDGTAEKPPSLAFHIANLAGWRLYMDKNQKLLWENSSNGQGVTSREILHTSNYSSYALPLSGGTIKSAAVPQLTLQGESSDAYITFKTTLNTADSAHSGLVNLPNIGASASFGVSDRIVFPFSGGMYYRNGYNGTNQTIWHAGNDGSGSGLDADLLDGLDATAFFYDKGASNSFDDKIYNGAYRTSSFKPNNAYGYGLVASFRSMETCAQIYFPDRNGEPQFRMQWNSQTSITSGWTALITSSSIGNYNAGSATKLATARTIWGQSFDGTGNVRGTLSGVHDIDFASKGNYVVGSFDKNANTVYTNNIHSGKGNNLWLKSTADTYITNSDGTTKFLTILSTGNVGIGTTSPAYKLDIVGQCRSQFMYFFNYDWNGNAGYIGRGSNGNNRIILYAESDDVYIYSKGVVSTIFSGANILVQGGITMYSARKLKNIQDERGLSLDELSVIKPTRFTWKDGRDDKVHIGGIADDVQKVLPEVIYKADNDILTMDYGNAAFAISASLIKPVITHEEEIKVLKNRIKELEEQVKTLSWNIA